MMTSSGPLDPVIDSLLNTVDLIELTQRLGIPTAREGASTKALCIFHEDTNPSMVLFNAGEKFKEHFHCFVCNSTADIFKLVQKKNDLKFADAVRWLADSYGIPSSKTSSRRRRVVDSTRSALADSGFEIALEIYRDGSVASALQNWLGQRGFAGGVPSDFETYFIRSGTLVGHLKQPRLSVARRRELLGQLEDVRLVRPVLQRTDAVRSEGSNFLNLGGSYRDYFYDERILFTLRDQFGQIAGFAGRRVEESGSEPKYLYTSGLKKSELLFRSNVAFERIKGDKSADTSSRTLYVCEGLTDVLRLEVLGLSAVGLLGSQMSDAQASLLVNFARGLPKGALLNVAIFLDRDTAGLRGASAALRKLLREDESIRVDLQFVWPDQLISPDQTKELKDPDELFRDCSRDEALAFLGDWTYCPAIPLLAAELHVLPEHITDDDKWSLLSLSRRYQAVMAVSKLSMGITERLVGAVAVSSRPRPRWKVDFDGYLAYAALGTGSRSQKNPSAVNDDDVRLNLARELAESGTRRGELPTDVAAWRRIDMAATAFNEGIKARLQMRDFRPLEPFDAVFVSRGFGKAEPRLKTMPAPEDLVAQQYLMSELLSERWDGIEDTPFSHYIPAVRFNRRGNETFTTGERGEGRLNETLSFAYQIDMDVLEGRYPAGEAGMFRPYFECWRDFVQTLTRQSKHMPAVHMIRVDVKRYYDRLHKVVVRDALRGPIDLAFNKIDEEDHFATWFGFPESKDERSQAIVDWLLDQSFAYKYFHPATGEAEFCDGDQVGIPQGPILSAWMGSIALFPIDAALRERLISFNSDGNVRAGYARYVDDIVLLADSLEVLGVLRAAAEDAARALQVELVTKETSPVMTAEDFSKHLTEGRALATSGPVGEIALLPAGDGDLGWYMLSAEPPKRYAALQLLRDHYLYHATSERLLDQIGTALRSEDLRPSELGKAARWVWYWAASGLSDEETEPARIFQKYWEGWRQVCVGTFWTLEATANHWDDPALYALEGLEKLFESARWGEETLTTEQNDFRIKQIAKVASLARSLDFIEIFNMPGVANAPEGWGVGARGLPRMFWQRVASMRWKAVQLCPAVLRVANALVPIQLSNPTSRMAASLRRALITDAETCGTAPDIIAQKGGSNIPANALRDLFIWLHDAFVRLGATEVSSEIGQMAKDPLEDISNELNEVINKLNADGIHDPGIIFFLNILSALRPTIHIEAHSAERIVLSDEVRGYAVATFVSICDRDRVIRHLAGRQHLLPAAVSSEICVLLPPLPGIRPTGLISLVCNKPDDGGVLAMPPDVLALKWLTVFANLGSDPIPVLVEASAAMPPNVLPLEWTELSDGNHATLLEQRASWSKAWASKFFHAPPNFQPSVRLLSWVADVYEAVAQLNYDVERRAENPEDPVEYVPAWPYFIVSRSPDVVSDEALRIVLAFTPVPKSKITGLAFLRDGSRGLKSYEVAKEGSEFWRLGVAVTDLVGFSSELDKYSTLTLPDEETTEHYSPDRFLLRNVLRKLRGHFYRGEFLPRQKDKPHLPATIARSLRLLRSFPEGAGAREGVAYVLACDMETRAMARRISDGMDLSKGGQFTHLLEQTAKDVCRRMPLAWNRYIAEDVRGGTLGPIQASPRAWWRLNTRLKTLIGPADLSWKAFICGLDLVVVATWLRVFVFELAASELGNRVLTHSNHTVTEAWGIDECSFCSDINDDSFESLIKRFHSAKADGRPQSFFEFVTPIGWLSLFAAYSELLDDPSGQRARIIWDEKERVVLASLARRLSVTKAVSIDEEDAQAVSWPFEYLPEDEEPIDLESFSTFMLAAHLKCGFRVCEGIEAAWRFDPKEKTFVDSNLETWRFEGWQISISDGSAPEQTDFDGRVVRRWSETSDNSGKLLGVSACGDRLSNMLGHEKITYEGRRPILEDPETGSPVYSAPEKSARNRDLPDELNELAEAISTAGLDRPEGADDFHHPPQNFGESDECDALPPAGEPVQPPLPAELPELPGGNVPPRRDLPMQPPDPSRAPASVEEEPQVPIEITPPLGVSGSSTPPPMRAWRDVQGDAWMNRRSANSGHVRVALMQWRVDDTYRHPIFDLAVPSYAKGLSYKVIDGHLDGLEKTKHAARAEADHHKWQSCEMLPSWAEHRRRRLLDAAINACTRLNVHLLVLPEYSVRPDTVKWLKERILSKKLTLNVVAGTYRLFGNKTEPGFETLHREIVGLEDFDSLFGPSAVGKKNGSCLNYGERKALTTLLAPVANQYGKQIVAVFSRGKKYPSNAASEIINPLIRPWGPLFSISGLNSDLERRTPDGMRSAAYTPLSAAQIIGQILGTKKLHYFAELICSELFLPMSPINYKGLASEYRKLVVRFGGQKSEQNAIDDVLRDVMAVSDYLGTCSSSAELIRRTILLVPAMSGRSADYWTFGQSAVLAGGVTTVFCNAVAPKLGVGGSCFIGRKSWEFGAAVPGIPTNITPYSGWSRGIFYNTQEDTLGDKEQALVIADVDPLYMSEGKPRPQALPVPLQLVAYLPLAEVVRKKKSDVILPDKENEGEDDVVGGSCKICDATASTHSTPILDDHVLAHMEGIVKHWKVVGSHNSVMDPTQGAIFNNAKALGMILGESKKPYINRLEHWLQHWRELPYAGFPPAVLDWILVDLTTEVGEELPEIFVPPWGSGNSAP